MFLMRAERSATSFSTVNCSLSEVVSVTMVSFECVGEVRGLMCAAKDVSWSGRSVCALFERPE